MLCQTEQDPEHQEKRDPVHHKNGDLVAEETKHTVHWNLTKASKVMVIDEEGDLSEPVPFAQYLKKATHITEIKGKGMLKNGASMADRKGTLEHFSPGTLLLCFGASAHQGEIPKSTRPTKPLNPDLCPRKIGALTLSPKSVAINLDPNP